MNMLITKQKSGKVVLKIPEYGSDVADYMRYYIYFFIYVKKKNKINSRK